MTFITAIGIGMSLHFIFLSLNTIMMHGLSLIFDGKRSTFGNENNACAIIIVASQKTLPVMVAIVGKLGGALGEAGLELKVLCLQGQKGLPLEAIAELGKSCKFLKSLNCSQFHFLDDENLCAIAEAFPYLEELDISCPDISSED